MFVKNAKARWIGTNWTRSKKYHGKPWLPSQHVLDECQGFDLSLNRNELLHLFSADLKKYMKNNQAKDSYFTDLPRPIDKGKFLGMEIRDKSLHMSCVELDGRNLDERASKYELSQRVDLKQTGKLLEELEVGILRFLREQGLDSSGPGGKRIPLGISLSQLSGADQPADRLAHSELLRKLKQVFGAKQRHIIDVKAVVSEATATLMTGHWLNDSIAAGIVLGSCPELSYLEEGTEDVGTDRVRVRSYRLDSFGNVGEIDYLRTQHDVSLDMESSDTGNNRLGKLLKGESVAELVRLVLVKLVQDGALYSGQLTAPLMTPGTLTTSHLASVEKDAWGKQEYCLKVLGELHIDWPGRQDCVDTRHVVESLTRRAAHLSAGLVSTLPPKLTGATVEGSLAQELPGFVPALKHKISQLRQREMKIIQIPRSTVIGAALLAARLASLETSL